MKNIILCSTCQRRQFGSKKSPVRLGECGLCGGVFSKLNEIGERVIKELDATCGVKTFSVGTKLPKKTEATEELVWDTFGFEGTESIKGQLNREVGKWIERNSRYRFSREPDAKVLYDVESGSVGVSITPIFVFGKYNKFERGIRQTKRGEEEAVEGFMEPFFLRAVGGSRLILHGHGREDIDVLMLGAGRPFVAEIKEPKTRKPKLNLIMKEINRSLRGKIGVKGLRIANRREIEVLKKAHFDKTYFAKIETEGRVAGEVLSRLKPVLLFQRTPTRVLQRRADIVRKRRVKAISARLIDDHHASLLLTTEGGTYIKEFISGDGERTTPSVAKVLGTPTKCIELNVLAIHSKWFEDWW